jgi:nucleoside-diphosphate-sugar epimerase
MPQGFLFNMKILLTGAAGFTGLIFSVQAEQCGHSVVPLVADLTDQAALTKEVNAVQPDAVVHLAGISFVGHADSAAFYQVNVIGTTNLLSALAGLTKKPSCVLLASSANIYGNCEASPITELQPPAPINHYAMSKLAMEHMALTYADRLPIVIARPFNYVGIGQAPQFLIPKLVDHFLKRAEVIELGNIEVEREFNDVRMVVDAYLRLLVKGQPGETYNVCTGRPFALQAVLNALSSITNHEIAVQVNPAFVRENEIQSLCGSPTKLIGAIGPLKEYSLTDTLQTILKGSF